MTCMTRREEAGPAMESTFPDWSSLPRDLLVSIGKLTTLVLEDFMAFRATCASWNDAGGDDECLKSVTRPRVPFVLIPDRAKLYSLSREKSHCMRTPLPESKCRLSEKKRYSKRAPEAPPPECRKFIESGFGWVLAHAPSGEADLVYPFSGERIPLPNYHTLPEFHHPNPNNHGLRSIRTYDPFIRRSVLTANPSQTSWDYVLVVVSAFYMSFWRPGDRGWSSAGSARGDIFADVIFCSKDRKFYAVTEFSATEPDSIWVWDMVTESSLAVSMVLPFKQVCKRTTFNVGLVESLSVADDELLLVRFDRATRHFEVHRLDVTRGEVERIETRLKDAIFVGMNASFSILPDEDDPVIKSNSIYFTTKATERPDSDHQGFRHRRKTKQDECGISNNMGIFNLEDQSIQRFPPYADSRCYYTSPPLWVAPSSLSFMRSRHV